MQKKYRNVINNSLFLHFESGNQKDMITQDRPKDKI